MVFCTSRSVDKSKAMTGSMKASGKEDFTATQSVSYISELFFRITKNDLQIEYNLDQLSLDKAK